MQIRWLLMIAIVASSPATALADEGALSLAAGGGGALEAVRPAVGNAPAATWGAVPVGSLAVRYALSMGLELEAEATGESPTSWFHPDTSLATGHGVLVGTLAERISGIGARSGSDNPNYVKSRRRRLPCSAPW